jgi:DNA repair protein RadC
MNATKWNLVLEKVTDYKIEQNFVNEPKKVRNALNTIFNLENQSEEVFVIMGLDVGMKVIGAFEVHRGELDKTLISPREIFKRLIVSNAKNFFMAHNHPSGELNPSKHDILMTEAIADAGRLLDIQLLDHIIVGDGEYHSFREHGEFY